VSGRSHANGNGQSVNNGPDQTQRDWQLAEARGSGTTFWQLI
jgi:hypothetical protein